MIEGISNSINIGSFNCLLFKISPPWKTGELSLKRKSYLLSFHTGKKRARELGKICVCKLFTKLIRGKAGKTFQTNCPNQKKRPITTKDMINVLV